MKNSRFGGLVGRPCGSSLPEPCRDYFLQEWFFSYQFLQCPVRFQELHRPLTITWQAAGVDSGTVQECSGSGAQAVDHYMAGVQTGNFKGPQRQRTEDLPGKTCIMNSSAPPSMRKASFLCCSCIECLEKKALNNFYAEMVRAASLWAAWSAASLWVACSAASLWATWSAASLWAMWSAVSLWVACSAASLRAACSAVTYSLAVSPAHCTCRDRGR